MLPSYGLESLVGPQMQGDLGSWLFRYQNRGNPRPAPNASVGAAFSAAADALFPHHDRGAPPAPAAPSASPSIQQLAQQLSQPAPEGSAQQSPSAPATPPPPSPSTYLNPMQTAQTHALAPLSLSSPMAGVGALAPLTLAQGFPGTPTPPPTIVNGRPERLGNGMWASDATQYQPQVDVADRLQSGNLTGVSLNDLYNWVARDATPNRQNALESFMNLNRGASDNTNAAANMLQARGQWGPGGTAQQGMDVARQEALTRQQMAGYQMSDRRLRDAIAMQFVPQMTPDEVPDLLQRLNRGFPEGGLRPGASGPDIVHATEPTTAPLDRFALQRIYNGAALRNGGSQVPGSSRVTPPNGEPSINKALTDYIATINAQYPGWQNSPQSRNHVIGHITDTFGPTALDNWHQASAGWFPWTHNRTMQSAQQAAQPLMQR